LTATTIIQNGVRNAPAFPARLDRGLCLEIRIQIHPDPGIPSLKTSSHLFYLTDSHSY